MNIKKSAFDSNSHSSINDKCLLISIYHNVTSKVPYHKKKNSMITDQKLETINLVLHESKEYSPKREAQEVSSHR